MRKAIFKSGPLSETFTLKVKTRYVLADRGAIGALVVIAE